MKIRTENLIDDSEWDRLVRETYGKVYQFQQQGGCKSRGLFRFTVPHDETCDDDMNDEVPEVVNHSVMGVKFEAWKARDPKQPLKGGDTGSGPRAEQYAIDLWWARNFYPDFQTVANDLHAMGLLPAGSYTIDIDW